MCISNKANILVCCYFNMFMNLGPKKAILLHFLKYGGTCFRVMTSKFQKIN